ncbi:hypothetical protein IMSAGC004_02202 [Bacteroidaceae bacterium]|uniref:hypothetical protein n=1 Tax=uncultured Phocaeicola sp. TaxID=990718 RepID=UPI000E86911A|nr:hypothetical protein [uncultured Phocaeicola sp.]GFH99797.1 hypothetical protein IMSAGC004_02202 [Bacteroidaceae bacterium]HBV82522.1 hypothetical protein [Lachnospiraceae bacterium]
MKQKIIKTVKKLIGHCISVHPIVDINVYAPNENSFSGNSLQDSNVLIVGCEENLMQAAKDYYKNEGCYVSILKQGYQELTLEDINRAEDALLGHFDHIVNIIVPIAGCGLFHADYTYNNRDLERVIYQWMQVEANYLDIKQQRSSLHIVLVKRTVEHSEVLFHSIINMLRGLAKRLLAHGVIANGVSAGEDVPVDAVMQSLMFVTGKYGEVIAGEFIELKK